MSKKQVMRDDFEDVGAENGGEYAESRQTYELFTKPGLYSSEEFKRSLRFIKTALAAQFLDPASMTKAGATALAGDFAKVIHTIARQAAMHPEIVDATGGVSADNASNVASRARHLLASSAPATKEIFDTEIGRNTLGVVAASLASVVSAKHNVTDPQGAVTFDAVATAAPVPTQFYPAIILDFAMQIQAEYNKRGLEPMFVDAIAPIDAQVREAGVRSFNFEALNGPCGQVQGVVDILKKALVQGLDESFYRRDNRRFAADVNAPELKDMLVLSVHGMRAVLQSLIEMSIALGHVRRTTEKNEASPTAPKKSVYTIKEGTHFYNLIDAICEHRKYYNQTFAKDLSAYAALTKRKADEVGMDELITAPIHWANLEAVPKGKAPFATYVIRSSAIIVELETRARTSDYNNAPFAIGAKPESRAVGVPPLVFFFKYPEEIRLCAEILKERGNGLESKNLKKATASYITNLIAQDGPLHNETAAAAASKLAAIVSNAMKCSLLIFIARQCSESMAKASISDAVVKDVPK